MDTLNTKTAAELMADKWIETINTRMSLGTPRVCERYVTDGFNRGIDLLRKMNASPLLVHSVGQKAAKLVAKDRNWEREQRNAFKKILKENCPWLKI